MHLTVELMRTWFSVETEIFMDFDPNLIGMVETYNSWQHRLRKRRLQPNKKRLVLNLPNSILWINAISNTIILDEITRRNDWTNDKSLQLVRFDHWFDVLSPVEIIRIIKLLCNRVGKRLRNEVWRSESHESTEQDLAKPQRLRKNGSRYHFR